MRTIIYLYLVAVYWIETSITQDTGKFWQFTDIHYDANYSDDQASAIKCHRLSAELSEGDTHGVFGDYDCDAPWTLVVSAINAMKLIEPDPDFVLWTGDSVPHVPDTTLSPPKVLTMIQNVTSKLLEVFSSVPIFPVLGNHDAWPANQLPASPDGYYDNILYSCGWENLLDDDSKETFQKGGYYSMKTPSGHVVLALNTVLYYTQDTAGGNLTDPAIQFMWLEQQLSMAQGKGDKVYVVSHVPPGTMGRVPMQWFYNNFNERFLRLLQQYNDCILAAIFGHEHTDSFRIVYSHGAAKVPVYLAPAVTPWKSTIPGIGANNPSLRLYHYDRATGRVLDYSQYFLNLSAANQGGKADWMLEYQATEAYSIDDIGAEQLGVLVEKFSDKSSDTFDKYFSHNSVSHDMTTKCEGKCKVQHICAITNISYPVYKKCVDSNGKFGVSSHFPADMMNQYGGQKAGLGAGHSRGDNTPAYVYFVITGVVSLMSVVLLTITILCCRRRHVTAYFSQPQYMPINT